MQCSKTWPSKLGMSLPHSIEGSDKIARNSDGSRNSNRSKRRTTIKRKSVKVCNRIWNSNTLEIRASVECVHEGIEIDGREEHPSNTLLPTCGVHSLKVTEESEVQVWNA